MIGRFLLEADREMMIFSMVSFWTMIDYLNHFSGL